jgi:hypothetical protein
MAKTLIFNADASALNESFKRLIDTNNRLTTELGQAMKELAPLKEWQRFVKAFATLNEFSKMNGGEELRLNFYEPGENPNG